MSTNYLITYLVYDKSLSIIKQGRIRVKNKATSVDAQVSLEKYLKKKIEGFSKLVVKQCIEDSFFGIFKDIFGGVYSNSFKN